MKHEYTNEYKIGSLLWIKQEQINDLRSLLDGLLAGQVTVESAKQALACMDTDSVS